MMMNSELEGKQSTTNTTNAISDSIYLQQPVPSPPTISQQPSPSHSQSSPPPTSPPSHRPTTNIYLDDTIETFMYEKQALQIKCAHNLDELMKKNIHLGSMLRQAVQKQHQQVIEETELFRSIISLSMGLEDDLTCLDALEKKTEILNARVKQLLEKVLQVSQ